MYYTITIRIVPSHIVFPYTTLFRSKPESADPIPAIVDFREQLKKRGIDLLLMPVPPKAAIYPEKILPDVDLHGETDRKSTRLNSCHRCISYAVFCLKKISTIVYYIS